jgi:hypothetical protein
MRAFARDTLVARRALWCAAAACLLLAPAALAQQGPILLGRQQRGDLVFFAPPTGNIDLDYYQEHDVQKNSESASSSFLENRFQEILTLQTTGYIVHPNLVDLKLEGSYGLEQDLIRQDGANQDQTGNLYGWDLSATLLRKEEAPITLFTRRTTNTINEQFGPSLNDTQTTSGAILEWHSPTLPTRIEFDHIDQEQVALDNSQSFNNTQNTGTWHTQYRPNPHLNWSWNYTFNSGSSSSSYPAAGGTSTDQFTINQATLSNEWDFGPKAQNTLLSTVDYYDQTGTFGLSRLNYSEFLHLKHSDTLESNYTYTLQQEDVAGTLGAASTSDLLQSVQAQLVHHLYKSLVTTGTVGFQQLDQSPSGGDTEFYGNVNFDYVKTAPFGKITSTLTLGYDQTRNNALTNITPVVAQPQVFNGLQPLIIPGNNIQLKSLVITDSTGTKIYRNGIDYTAKSFPTYLELDRLLGGMIASGQEVLLNYNLGPLGASTVGTSTFGLSGRYELDKGPLRGIGVYANYLDQDQSISASPGEANLFVPNSVVDLTVGADFHRWELALNVDEDWHHSSIAPYDQLAGSVQWVHRFGTAGTLTMGPTYTQTKYLETNDELTALSFLASVTYQLSHEVKVTAALNWQDQKDKLFGNVEGLEEEAQIQWIHRQLTTFVMFRNSNLRTTQEQNNYLTLEVGIRRQF